MSNAELFTRGAINPVKVADLINSEHELIYCGNKFYEYEGGCYRHVEVCGIRKWIRNILGEESTTHKINEVVNTLRDNQHLPVDDLNKTDLLNVKNGMVDLSTLELKSHNPSYYSSVQLDVGFYQDAKCPKWTKTLNEIFQGNEIKISIFQEFFGLCFTKETKYQKALFCIGEGENGKSTLLEVLEAIIGKENISAVPLECFNNFHYVAGLYGKLINICVEVNAKTIVYESTFKNVISGGVLEADFKFQSSFKFHPFCKLLFAVNNMPRVDDKSHAFFRRLLILRFERIFGKHERNINLKAELLCEKDGIFLWALQGYQRLKERGYFDDDSLIQEVDEYKKENNNMLCFFEDKCKIQEGSEISKSDLYLHYKTWCEDNGFHPMSQHKLTKELKKSFNLKELKRSEARYWENVQVH